MNGRSFSKSRRGSGSAAACWLRCVLPIYATAMIAEIVRAGILAVAKGQVEAARSLGLSGVQAFVYVTFPQAMRMMVPPLVGQYIILIKETSIGGVVGLDELLRRTVILYTGFQNPTQALIVAAAIYFILLCGLSMFSRRLELKDARLTPRIPDEVLLQRPQLAMVPAAPRPPR
jgi:ABC-type amino acid transport system permease subunit